MHGLILCKERKNDTKKPWIGCKYCRFERCKLTGMEERCVHAWHKITEDAPSSNVENNTNNALHDISRISRKYQLAEISRKFRFHCWNSMGQFSEVIYID